VEWIGPVRDFWWLLGVLIAILATLWRMAIRTNESKESLRQVATNKEAIEKLQDEMTTLKADIKDIKDDTSRTADDVSAILSAVQSLMLGCDTAARDKFNDYLAHR
jgi:cell division protein FtsB